MERQPEISGAIRAAGTALYYIPGALAGQIAAWPAHLARARGLGFRQICTAPLARPGQRGDLFLTADFDKPDPRLGDFDSTEAAIEAAATAARKAASAGSVAASWASHRFAAGAGTLASRAR